MRLAIMQPMFIPYAGYFRLFDVDLFVFYDDAQYTKQTWINRNRLTGKDGEVGYLTLPIKSAPTETKIKDLEFADEAPGIWAKQIKKFKVFEKMSVLNNEVLFAPNFGSPLKAIRRSIDCARELLGLSCLVTNTSGIADKLDPSARGQERVLAICEHFKAKDYINAVGGVGLYSPEKFKSRGINLHILQPYEGSMLSIVERLAFEDPAKVGKEILDNVKFIS